MQIDLKRLFIFVLFLRSFQDGFYHRSPQEEFSYTFDHYSNKTKDFKTVEKKYFQQFLSSKMRGLYQINVYGGSSGLDRCCHYSITLFKPLDLMS